MFHYKDCGLSTVWLINGYVQENLNNELLLRIEDKSGLHRLIAKALINRRGSLTGLEMYFIRNEMNLLRQELGEKMGVNALLISQWEQSYLPLPRRADIELRTIFVGLLLEESERVMHVHLLSESGRDRFIEQLIFTFSDMQWQRYVPLPGSPTGLEPI
ncbi:hypothetical protein [Sodalis sp. dw_96]|uniref:hypothetical protein n=1 Tax=Sodalis sp. dw_96 TaxID=2719794 RepID=UPI001BD2E89C|nr:hypothetical protein [Sodalis sp. dw_96]